MSTSNPIIPPVVDYARPTILPPPNPKLIVTAIVCGALPLVTGFVVFLLWVVTHAVVLVIAGILVLDGGLLLFLIGTICLLIHTIRELQIRRKTTVAILGQALAVGLLLLANFPAEWAIILMVDK